MLQVMLLRWGRRLPSYPTLSLLQLAAMVSESSLDFDAAAAAMASRGHDVTPSLSSVTAPKSRGRKPSAAVVAAAVSASKEEEVAKEELRTGRLPLP